MNALSNSLCLKTVAWIYYIINGLKTQEKAVLIYNENVFFLSHTRTRVKGEIGTQYLEIRGNNRMHFLKKGVEAERKFVLVSFNT